MYFFYLSIILTFAKKNNVQDSARAENTHLITIILFLTTYALNSFSGGEHILKYYSTGHRHGHKNCCRYHCRL